MKLVLHLKFVRRWLPVLLGAALLGEPARAADSLRWYPATKRLDARVETWDVPTMLGRLASATGWSVFVEPGATNRVAVKFRGAAQGDALRLLLGDLSFALLPDSSGRSKLLVFKTGLTQATRLVATGADDRRKPIPDELIVSMRAGAKQSIDDLARKLGATIVGKIDGLNSFRLRFADDAAARQAEQTLATNPDAEADYNYSLERPTPIDLAGADGNTGFNLKPKVSSDSKQVIIGLIDTPVQPLPAEMQPFVLPGINVTGDPATTSDELAHGTSMAETILHGLNFGPKDASGSPVRILPVDIYGASGETTTFELAKGIYSAINSGATIINLSLSGDGDSRYLSSLISAARQEGVLFFSAAGNTPSTAPTFPAAYPDVVAVTAGDRRGNIAAFANRGNFVDVIAPGTSFVRFQGDTYVVTGTSPSTAYVSGAAASYRASGMTPDQVEATIRQSLAVPAGHTPPVGPR